MTSPVTSIQPPQIPVSPQNSVANQTTPEIAAKKIKDEVNTTTAEKPKIGVVEPPKDTYQFSVNNLLKQKEAEKQDIASTPLAASGLSGTKTGASIGFLTKLLLTAGAATGIYFLGKQIKLSRISAGNLSNATDIKKHLSDIISIAKKGEIKPFHLKKTSVRLIDESPDTIKNVLKEARKLAEETRNVEGKTPRIVLKIKDGAKEVEKEIKEAFTSGNFDSIGEASAKKLEYLKVDYIQSSKESTDVIVDTITSKIKNSNGSKTGDTFPKLEKFLKDFLGD